MCATHRQSSSECALDIPVGHSASEGASSAHGDADNPEETTEEHTIIRNAGFIGGRNAERQYRKELVGPGDSANAHDG